MSNIVRFPGLDNDDLPEVEEQAGAPVDEADGEAELYILNLYRSRANHPAGRKLIERRAE